MSIEAITKIIGELRAKAESKKQEAIKLNENSKIEEAEKILEELRGINKEIKEKEEMRDFIIKNGNGGEEQSKKNFSEAILPGEPMKKSINDYPEKTRGLSLGKLLRGAIKGTWSNAEKEQKYYRSMSYDGNKVLIPSSISDSIFDMARNQEGFLNTIPIMPMDDNKMTVIAQSGDATANWHKDGDLIPVSDITFDGVDLEGKELTVFVNISEKLLDTSIKNLESSLLNSISKAIRVSLDEAIMHGNDENGIKGLSEYETINKTTYSNKTIDYNMLLTGIRTTKKNNEYPNNICLNTDTMLDLEMQKDSIGQYIERPKALEQYKITESNNCKENESWVYNLNSLVLGVQKDISLEWGYTADGFQRNQKSIRCIVRCDLGVIKPKGITQVIFNKVEQAAS